MPIAAREWLLGLLLNSDGVKAAAVRGHVSVLCQMLVLGAILPTRFRAVGIQGEAKMFAMASSTCTYL
jgi:hypothetical protein